MPMGEECSARGVREVTRGAQGQGAPNSPREQEYKPKKKDKGRKMKYGEVSFAPLMTQVQNGEGAFIDCNVLSLEGKYHNLLKCSW